MLTDRSDFVVPEAFRDWIVASQGVQGQAWLSELPAIIEHLRKTWTLTISGKAMHGGEGLVVPVLQAGSSFVLKLSSRSESTMHEATALRHWSGRGMVNLVNSDDSLGAMLLEALGPESLDALPWQDSIPIVGDLIKLHSIEAGDSIPTVQKTAQLIAADLKTRWPMFGKPMPERLIDMSRALIENHAHSPSSKMVNKDLHFENVLKGHRAPWIAIDPKPLKGDPEFGPAQIFWRVVDQLSSPRELRMVFDIITERSELDRQRFRDWTLVRVVDYWLWALSVGLTEDPRRCATVIDWLGY